MPSVFSGGVGMIVDVSVDTLSAATGDRFYALVGITTDNATAANRQLTPPFGAKYSRLQLVVSANTLDTDATWAFNVNGSDTALILTIPAGVSALFADNTNQVTTAYTDALAYFMDIGSGVGAVTIRGLAVAYQSLST